jgi:hypothetical protein
VAGFIRALVRLDANRADAEGIMTMMAAETQQRPRQNQHGAFYKRCNSFGSLAKFTAIRRASSLVSSLAADRRPGSSSK